MLNSLPELYTNALVKFIVCNDWQILMVKLCPLLHFDVSMGSKNAAY